MIAITYKLESKKGEGFIKAKGLCNQYFENSRNDFSLKDVYKLKGLKESTVQSLTNVIKFLNPILSLDKLLRVIL